MSAAIDLILGVGEVASYLCPDEFPRWRNFWLWVFAGGVFGALSTLHASPHPTLVSTALWLGVPTGLCTATFWGGGAAIAREPRFAHALYGLGFGLMFALCRHAMLFE